MLLLLPPILGMIAVAAKVLLGWDPVSERAPWARL
jgi:hypothetical protein